MQPIESGFISVKILTRMILLEAHTLKSGQWEVAEIEK